MRNQEETHYREDNDAPLASSEAEVILSMEEFQMFKSAYVSSYEKTVQDLKKQQKNWESSFRSGWATHREQTLQ